METGRPLEQFNYAITTKEGKLRELETSVSLIKYADEKPVGFRGLIIDITDRKTTEQEKKKLEAQLRQAHKMEAIGTLAGGIAHDFNNILSGIFGYSQLAEVNIENPLKAKGHIEKIIKAARRAAGLTQQILTFSRKSEDEKVLVNISVVVKEALRLLRSSIPTTIEIHEHIDSKATALADPTQIHQIIMNLCTNAYHAMRSKGGTLTVKLIETQLLKENSVSTLNTRSGKYLKLMVSDTGHGMDEDTMSKVFDPYFTTKELSDGTGLGLALVYGIVDDHGGFIKVSSVIEKGSVFQVFLPITESSGMPDHQTLVDPPVAGGTERVMVVDDEDSIRYSTKEYLEDYGYTVTAFSNGNMALKAFSRNTDQFDLIITDMTMPKMTGDELARMILEIKHDMPIILCTGYSEKITKKRVLDIGIMEYIQKPVDCHNLLLLIRDVLDNPSKITIQSQ